MLTSHVFAIGIYNLPLETEAGEQHTISWMTLKLDGESRQDGQYTYNVTLKRVRVIVTAVENRYVLHILIASVT